MRTRRAAGAAVFAALVIVAVGSSSGIAAPVSTTRVSVDSTGVQGNDNSYAPAFSADGRYVAFLSKSTNLVPGDVNGFMDVFVHDRATGATSLESLDSLGLQGNDRSFDPKLSADARYVAFGSVATNLVLGDTNGWGDVYVRDRETQETTRVSVDSNGVQGNSVSEDVTISADGRFVAFESDATNLVPGDTNGGGDVFVHDRQTGQTTRVSIGSGGAQANGVSGEPEISDDGSIVAFSSKASNLVPGDTNRVSDIFVHDLQTGETRRVSLSTSGGQGNKGSDRPVISSDGSVVAFDSLATNLVAGDTNRAGDVFAHDRASGATTRLSVRSSGAEDGKRSYNPEISGDGRLVSFNADARLVDGDTNRCADVYLHDRATGETTRESVDSSGHQANRQSVRSAIPADGSLVGFGSMASNLVGGDTNGSRDVFVRELGASSS